MLFATSHVHVQVFAHVHVVSYPDPCTSQQRMDYIIIDRYMSVAMM